jgi:hypothetical protein
VGFDVLTTCQLSTVWCSCERIPAAAAQPAQGSSEPVAPRIFSTTQDEELGYRFGRKTINIHNGLLMLDTFKTEDNSYVMISDDSQ